MHERTKELIKQLAAELEFVTIPALYRDIDLYGNIGSERRRNDYITAKDVQKELKELYKILSKTTITERISK